MDIAVLTGWLTEGLDEAEAAIVRKAIERDAVKSKASGLKAQDEFDKIVQERAVLQAELEGDAANSKVGTRAYKEWYDKNFELVQANDKAIKAFDEKHGTGAFKKALDGELKVGETTVAPTAGVLSADEIQKIVDAKLASFKPTSAATAPEDIQKLVDKRIQEGYAPRWASLLKDTGKVVQRHVRAGRSTDIDFEALEKLAAEKTNGSLEAAYDMWDQPEREKEAKASQEKEIERRVNEEIQKRGASREFPAGADATPGFLSRTGGDEKFNKNSLVRDLARDWDKVGTAVTQ